MLLRKPERLVIFDLDGTLCPLNSTELLLGVIEWAERNRHTQCALATNQGGVGLRYWMEKDGFGNPSAYPNVAMVEKRLSAVKAALPIQSLRLYVCYAYITKKGQQTPVPEGEFGKSMWMLDHRKPAPGMLLRAMRDAQVRPSHTVMVGDRDEDMQAAQRAGCGFVTADEFFGRINGG